MCARPSRVATHVPLSGSKTPSSSSLPSRCLRYSSVSSDSSYARAVRHSGTRWSALSVRPCPVNGAGQSRPSGRPIAVLYGTWKSAGSVTGVRRTTIVSSSAENGLPS